MVFIVLLILKQHNKNHQVIFSHASQNKTHNPTLPTPCSELFEVILQHILTTCNSSRKAMPLEDLHSASSPLQSSGPQLCASFLAAICVPKRSPRRLRDTPPPFRALQHLGASGPPHRSPYPSAPQRLRASRSARAAGGPFTSTRRRRNSSAPQHRTMAASPSLNASVSSRPSPPPAGS